MQRQGVAKKKHWPPNSIQFSSVHTAATSLNECLLFETLIHQKRRPWHPTPVASLILSTSQVTTTSCVLAPCHDPPSCRQGRCRDPIPPTSMTAREQRRRKSRRSYSKLVLLLVPTLIRSTKHLTLNGGELRQTRRRRTRTRTRTRAPHIMFT